MAKILKNDNESPEVDLKNLTVKLSGMGLDEEIEDMIPGKKKKGKKNADENADEEEDTSKEEASEEEESTESDEPEDEPEEDENEEDVSDSEDGEEIKEKEEKTDDEVEAFYEKRAAERDLTLEKVEAIASEMDSDDSETKVVKNIKKAAVKEKKKAKLDAFGICAIVLAVLVLLGGAFYIYLSVKKEPDLGMTEKDFRVKYSQTPIFRSIMDFGFALSEPTYRKTDAAASESTSQSASETTAATETTAPVSAVTSEAESKYKYFDSYIHSYFFTVYVNGCESKNTGNLKMLRFIIPTEDEEGIRGTATATFAAFLQVFFPELNSDACVQKITDAYNQSKASASPAVIIKDGDIAYSVSYNEIDNVPCIVMDLIPAKDASKYVFYTSYGM